MRDSCETQRGRSPPVPATLGRARRRRLRCYRYRLAASPQWTLLPGQAGRLPERPGGAAGRCRAGERRAAVAAALPARRGGGGRRREGGRAGGGGARTRRQRAGRLWRAGQGRAAALVGPGGPPAAAVAAGGVRRRGVAPAFLPPAPARLFPLAYCEGQRTCSERSLCREGGRPVPSPLGRLPGTRWGVVAARFHRGPGQGGRQGPL